MKKSFRLQQILPPSAIKPVNETIPFLDWEKCVLCQEDVTSEKLVTGTAPGIKTLAKNLIQFQQIDAQPSSIQ